MKLRTGLAAAAAFAAIVFGFLALPGGQAAPQGVPLRILASNAVRTTVEELRAQCQQAVGRPLSIEYNPSSAIKKEIESGASFDVVIGAADLIDGLIAQGTVLTRSRADIAQSAVGVGIRAGSPRPDLRSPEAMKKALLAAKAVSYTKDGASQPLILKMTDKLGVTPQVNAKTLAEPTTVVAGADVVAGRADMLLTMTSEILPIQGLELAGPIPAAFERYLMFSAGVSAKSSDAKAGEAVIKFLTTAAVIPVLQSRGMEPPKPR